jgi:hypothetical protein
MITMHLVQILLPLYDNQRARFPQAAYDEVSRELTEKFGGVTSFVRSPGEGLWKEGEGNVSRDEVLMFEVLTESVQRKWWKKYRRVLEQRFSQHEIVVIAVKIKKL